jgi:hypothetical protein
VKASESDALEDISAGAWTRLRNLIGALDRVDRLETSTDFVGWLHKLARDETGLQETILDFMLRALRLGLDPVNWRILSCLAERGPLPTSALMQAAGLSRVELVERMNELARAGLTVQVLDGDQVEATRFSQGLLTMVAEVTEQVKRLAENDYLLKGPARPARLDQARAQAAQLDRKD